MRRLLFIVLCLIGISSLPVGCTTEPAETIEAGLEETFRLYIGEEAVITGEDLRIGFEEVIEDSRCPKNVECIWEGQARYALRYTRGKTSERVVLTESAMLDWPTQRRVANIVLLDYRISTTLEPYPEGTDTIATERYRLQISVQKITPYAFDTGEQADIYAAVIRQLYEVDHTFGSSPPDFPNLYLVYMTDDRVARVLPESLRTAIADRLSDLPTEIYWVSSFEEVPLEENSTVEGGGVVIRVSNFFVKEDGTLLLAGSIYIANLAAGGRTYILEKQEGTWRITGDTGKIWTS